MSLEREASDLFGGKFNLRKRLVATIRSERRKLGISADELYHKMKSRSPWPLEYTPTIISEIEAGKRLIDKFLTLETMSILMISIDDERIMGMPPLTEAQKLYWITQYLASGDGPIHASKVNQRGEAENFTGELDDDIQLGIYLRLKALEELNTP